VDFERYSIAARTDFRQFGVVLPDINEGADAAAVTKRLVESLQKPIRINERDINVTACAGISLFPQDGSDAETLFANAMTAMDDARRHRPEPYKFHSGTLKMRALERKDLELELRSALDREEFDLNYLPIVDANTQEPITVEALLRWPTALFGSKSIRRVITLAEHTGLIVPIGDWVMRQSCKQLRDWHALGHTDLRLAVNLSVQEFSRPNLVQRIRSILEDCAIDPASLDLEITEHMLFRDAMKGFDVCLALKGLGVGIILDDYGTGACSLAHLSRSPVDAVKIDNGFVAEAITSESERSACAAITAMAHQLGLRAIAEGVETEEQAQMLRDQGCDLLQGFLFCKPSAADEFAEYLDRFESSRGPQE
jgi:EAL domain-containing protein (putative c-di-GMP-specific phosphodiesterase class I)